MDAEELIRIFIRALRSEGSAPPSDVAAPRLMTSMGERPGFITSAQAAEHLRYRSTFFDGASRLKSTLRDGRKGYRVRAEAECEIILGPDPSDPAAKRELIKMNTSEAQVFIADPVLTIDGMMRVDLEIMSFTLEGTSSTLVDEEVPIKMHCGRLADRMMRPTFGRIEVPQGLEFSQAPVKVVHEVFVSIETPLGVLHNREAAIMMGYVTKMPPFEEKYEQVGRVDLFNEAGVMVASKATQRSFIRGLAEGSVTE